MNLLYWWKHSCPGVNGKISFEVMMKLLEVRIYLEKLWERMVHPCRSYVLNVTISELNRHKRCSWIAWKTKWQEHLPLAGRCRAPPGRTSTGIPSSQLTSCFRTNPRPASQRLQLQHPGARTTPVIATSKSQGVALESVSSAALPSCSCGVPTPSAVLYVLRAREAPRAQELRTSYGSHIGILRCQTAYVPFELLLFP